MANTVVSITGPDFLINGNRTYRQRTYNGMRIEGLLFNSRMVQGIFDDLNPETRRFWDYPDGPWDPERNTREFVSAMPEWRDHGLLSFTINLQGGSPYGYSEGRSQFLAECMSAALSVMDLVRSPAAPVVDRRLIGEARSAGKKAARWRLHRPMSSS